MIRAGGLRPARGSGQSRAAPPRLRRCRLAQRPAERTEGAVGDRAGGAGCAVDGGRSADGARRPGLR